MVATVYVVIPGLAVCELGQMALSVEYQGDLVVGEFVLAELARFHEREQRRGSAE
jgi:hypothetical protein